VTSWEIASFTVIRALRGSGRDVTCKDTRWGKRRAKTGRSRYRSGLGTGIVVG
jgi:hypothetical protein